MKQNRSCEFDALDERPDPRSHRCNGCRSNGRLKELYRPWYIMRACFRTADSFRLHAYKPVGVLFFFFTMDLDFLQLPIVEFLKVDCFGWIRDKQTHAQRGFNSLGTSLDLSQIDTWPGSERG